MLSDQFNPLQLFTVNGWMLFYIITQQININILVQAIHYFKLIVKTTDEVTK